MHFLNPNLRKTGDTDKPKTHQRSLAVVCTLQMASKIGCMLSVNIQFPIITNPSTDKSCTTN